MIVFETHPFHLHGYSFYVVGRGTGNYDPETSPATFNLVNPPLRNTFGVPHKGWIALRFRADNPGTRLSFPCTYQIVDSFARPVTRLPKEVQFTKRIS